MGVKLAVTVLLAAALIPVGAPPAYATTRAKPHLTEAERAAAIVAPAMIFVEVRWEGWVRRWTGALADDDSIVVTTRCTGFAVSNDGYLLTAPDCVAPEAVESAFFAEVARRRIEQGQADPGSETEIITDLANSAAVVGQPFDSPPKREVRVQRGEALAGAESGEIWPAEVVDIAEDVALLKSTKGNQPMLALGGEPELGQQVLTTQYPGAAPGETVRPATRVGSIAAVEPTLIAHAGPTPGLPGAPVTDLGATVVGLVTVGEGPTRARDQLAGADAMRALLARHEVANELGPLDTNFRDGIDALMDARYTDAVENFDAVLAIVPSHKQALEYRQQAQALRLEEGGGPRSESTTVVAALSGAVAFLVISGIVAYVLRRRRERPLI